MIKFSKQNQVGSPKFKYTYGKYHNIPSQYNGRIYHSHREAEYAILLDDMKKHKEIKSWTPQYTLRLDINGHHICNYIADFLVNNNEIHECKGFFTPIGKIKWKLAQALFSKKYKFVLIK